MYLGIDGSSGLWNSFNQLPTWEAFMLMNYASWQAIVTYCCSFYRFEIDGEHMYDEFNGLPQIRQKGSLEDETTPVDERRCRACDELEKAVAGTCPCERLALRTAEMMLPLMHHSWWPTSRYVACKDIGFLPVVGVDGKIRTVQEDRTVPGSGMNEGGFVEWVEGAAEWVQNVGDSIHDSIQNEVVAPIADDIYPTPAPGPPDGDDGPQGWNPFGGFGFKSSGTTLNLHQQQGHSFSPSPPAPSGPQGWSPWFKSSGTTLDTTDTNLQSLIGLGGQLEDAMYSPYTGYEVGAMAWYVKSNAYNDEEVTLMYEGVPVQTSIGNVLWSMLENARVVSDEVAVGAVPITNLNRPYWVSWGGTALENPPKTTQVDVHSDMRKGGLSQLPMDPAKKIQEYYGRFGEWELREMDDAGFTASEEDYKWFKALDEWLEDKGILHPKRSAYDVNDPIHNEWDDQEYDPLQFDPNKPDDKNDNMKRGSRS